MLVCPFHCSSYVNLTPLWGGVMTSLHHPSIHQHSVSATNQGQSGAGVYPSSHREAGIHTVRPSQDTHHHTTHGEQASFRQKRQKHTHISRCSGTNHYNHLFKPKERAKGIRYPRTHKHTHPRTHTHSGKLNWITIIVLSWLRPCSSLPTSHTLLHTHKHTHILHHF